MLRDKGQNDNFLNLTLNQAKDLQETLKRIKKIRRTDVEPPPITKELKTENAPTVKHCRKKKNNRTIRGGFKSPE